MMILIITTITKSANQKQSYVDFDFLRIRGNKDVFHNLAVIRQKGESQNGCFKKTVLRFALLPYYRRITLFRVNAPIHREL